MASAIKAQQRLQHLNIAIRNEAFLSNEMKDYDNGIETQAVDNRSLYELRNDANFMRQEFEKKVYNLFSNDNSASNHFISNFDEDDISDFNVVYPQLLKLYKGSRAHPATVLATTMQLIDNMDNTGSINQSSNNISDQIEEIKDFVEQQYKQGNINLKKGNELTDILNAVAIFEDPQNQMQVGSEKWTSLRSKISDEVNGLLKLIMSNNIDNESLENIMKSLKTKMITVRDSSSKAERDNIATQKKIEKAKNKQLEQEAKTALAKAAAAKAEAKRLAKKNK